MIGSFAPKRRGADEMREESNEGLDQLSTRYGSPYRSAKSKSIKSLPIAGRDSAMIKEVRASYKEYIEAT